MRGPKSAELGPDHVGEPGEQTIMKPGLVEDRDACGPRAVLQVRGRVSRDQGGRPRYPLLTEQGQKLEPLNIGKILVKDQGSGGFDILSQRMGGVDGQDDGEIPGFEGEGERGADSGVVFNEQNDRWWR